MDRKILIADDEEGIRDLFRFLLEPQGFEVFTARDGAEAVEVVEKEFFGYRISGCSYAGDERSGSS